MHQQLLDEHDHLLGLCFLYDLDTATYESFKGAILNGHSVYAARLTDTSTVLTSYEPVGEDTVAVGIVTHVTHEPLLLQDFE